MAQHAVVYGYSTCAGRPKICGHYKSGIVTPHSLMLSAIDAVRTMINFMKDLFRFGPNRTFRNQVFLNTESFLNYYKERHSKRTATTAGTTTGTVLNVVFRTTQACVRQALA